MWVHFPHPVQFKSKYFNAVEGVRQGCDDTAMHAMLSAREGIQHVTLQIPVLSHSKPDNKSLIIQYEIYIHLGTELWT
jgi:hypothetical protein